MSRTKAVGLDEAIAAIVGNAERLRAAGVTRVRFGDLEFDLAPPDVTEAIDERIEQRFGPVGVEHVGPLDDPATFGRRDGKVPGYRREREDKPAED